MHIRLLIPKKILKIVVTSDKAIDGWYLGKHTDGNALDVNVWRSNSNIFKTEKSGRVMGVWFEDFDKIYDGDTVVWEKE